MVVQSHAFRAVREELVVVRSHVILRRHMGVVAFHGIRHEPRNERVQQPAEHNAVP